MTHQLHLTDENILPYLDKCFIKYLSDNINTVLNTFTYHRRGQDRVKETLIEHLNSYHDVCIVYNTQKTPSSYKVKLCLKSDLLDKYIDLFFTFTVSEDITIERICLTSVSENFDLLSFEKLYLEKYKNIGVTIEPVYKPALQDTTVKFIDQYLNNQIEVDNLKTILRQRCIAATKTLQLFFNLDSYPELIIEENLVFTTQSYSFKLLCNHQNKFRLSSVFFRSINQFKDNIVKPDNISLHFSLPSFSIKSNYSKLFS